MKTEKERKRKFLLDSEKKKAFFILNTFVV